jgi:hypothetical protein
MDALSIEVGAGVLARAWGLGAFAGTVAARAWTDFTKSLRAGPGLLPRLDTAGDTVKTALNYGVSI